MIRALIFLGSLIGPQIITWWFDVVDLWAALLVGGVGGLNFVLGMLYVYAGKKS